LLSHFRSLPFGWHGMLMLALSPYTSYFFIPQPPCFELVIKARWHAWRARLRSLFLSSAVRNAAACKFLDGLSPVGQNVLDLTLVTKA